jgi:hypothetical protein
LGTFPEGICSRVINNYRKEQGRDQVYSILALLHVARQYAERTKFKMILWSKMVDSKHPPKKINLIKVHINSN